MIMEDQTVRTLIDDTHGLKFTESPR